VATGLHTPLSELFLVYRLMRRATGLMQTSEIQILLNLPAIILVMIFVNVKTSIMLMLFLEQAHGRPTWSLQATWPNRFQKQKSQYPEKIGFYK